METIALVCRNKVGGNIRGLSAAAFLAAASVMGCQPDPGEDCKGKACDVSNPDDSGTPTDITDTTDDADPTCPGDPDCPPVEVPDTTPPAAPQFGLGDRIIVGPSVTSVSVPITVSTDTAALDLQLNGGTWTLEDFSDGTVFVPAGATAKIRAKDAAGNISPEDSFTVDIDSEGPLALYPDGVTQVILGPDQSAADVTFMVAQPDQTQKILASIDDGAYSEIAYSAGATKATVPNVPKGSHVKTKGQDSFANESAESLPVFVKAEVAPDSAQLSQNLFQLGATTPATFSFDVTPATGAKQIIIKDGEGNTVFSSDVTPPSALPVTMPNPGTNTTYTVYSVAEKGTQDAGTPFSAEIMPAPRISNLAIDCSVDGGICIAYGSTYPVSFDIGNGINWTASVEKIGGVGTAGTLSQYSGSMINGTVNVNYTTGSGSDSVVRIKVTVQGKANQITEQFIDVVQW